MAKETITVLGFEVVLDEEMGPEQVALVNDDGRGYSIEDGEITPCILPPPRRATSTDKPAGASVTPEEES